MHLSGSQALCAPEACPGSQTKALSLAPPLLPSCLLTAECPLGWHGPGCQSPCECEHQCPCDPQTGNCNLTLVPTLSSFLSQGTAPPQPPGGREGRPSPPGSLSLSLVSFSEAVSPATPGHPADKRALPSHWVGALVGSGAGVGGDPLPLLGKASRWQLSTQVTFLQWVHRERHS